MDEQMRDGSSARDASRISRREALRRSMLTAGALAAPAVLSACGSSSTSGSSGSTATAPDAATLKPFDPSVGGGSPTDLAKTIAFPGAYTDPGSLALSDAFRDAAEAADFDYVTAVANGDIARLTSQMDAMLQRGFCATFMYPGNEPATRPLAERALDAGACVFGGGGRPYSTVQVIEDQTVTGRQIGRIAADWIRRNLDGKAQIVYFNEDSSPTLVARHRAALAELEKLGPGAEIVSDIEVELTPEAGANAMSTILQAHPGANVVIGGAGPIGGAYATFDSKGRSKDPEVFLAGVGGSDADLAKIADDTIYRATLSLPWELYGWAMGVFGVDWQAGRSVPRLMSPPSNGNFELSSPEAISTFRADMRDPKATWENKRDDYIALWGNIDYSMRDTYWRTEARLPDAAA